jgi:hypothetical protein
MKTYAQSMTSLQRIAARKSNRGAVIRRFENADEVRTFENGTFEIVRLAGTTLGRATYQPGWKWSEHVRPTGGTDLCELEHIGWVLSARAKVLMRDGEEIELAAGDLFHIAPGHDSWVVGDQPYISLNLLGAEEYAATSR